MKRHVLKIPKDILERWVKWGNIYFNPGSGQFPGGNPKFTGAQWPAILIRCEDGTCQQIEIPVPEELIEQDDYVKEALSYYKKKR